jgi:hypothetical protein
MRQYRLSSYGEPEPCSARLARHVGIPNSREALRRDTAARVAHRDHDTVFPIAPIARDRDADARRLARRACTIDATRVDRIEQHVRQRTRQRVMMPAHHRHIAINVNVGLDVGRHRHARSVPHELSDIDIGRWTFRQSPELGEAPRHLLQSPRLGVEHIDDVGKRCGSVAPKPCDGEPDRCQWVLELVRDLSRGFAERAEPLGLDLASSRVLELACDRAHSGAQHRELGSALAGLPFG